MHRIMTTLAIVAMFAGSPAIAGGSVEEPTDKKAPVSDKTGSDNPASAGEGPAKPAGEGAPVPEDAAKGTLETSPEEGASEEKK